MELRRYFAVLRSRWIFIAVTVAIAVVAAWQITPHGSRYEATATLYVGARNIDAGSGSRDLSGDRAAAIDRLVSTFALMIDSEPIAADAISEGNLSKSPAQVVSETSTKGAPGTSLLYILVKDSDPTAAQTTANALAESFVDAVQDFEPGVTGQEGGVPTLPAYIFERAKLPTTPLPTPLVNNLVLGLLIGLGVSIGVVLLLDYLDVTVRTPEDVERRLELPVLGVIPTLGAELPLTPTLRAQRVPTG